MTCICIFCLQDQILQKVVATAFADRTVLTIAVSRNQLSKILVVHNNETTIFKEILPYVTIPRRYKKWINKGKIHTVFFAQFKTNVTWPKLPYICFFVHSANFLLICWNLDGIQNDLEGEYKTSTHSQKWHKSPYFKRNVVRQCFCSGLITDCVNQGRWFKGYSKILWSKSHFS